MRFYVLGFLFTEDRKNVVLIRKTKPEWQAGRYNGVGGKVEEGETFKEAMIREFREETGCDFNDWESFAVMRNSQFIVDCFKGFAKGGETFQSMTEEIVKVIPVNDILTDQYQIISNLKWLVSMALDKGFNPVKIDYQEAEKYIERYGNNKTESGLTQSSKIESK